jgi:glucokinase
MNEIVAIDIGGTHARFALARIDGGRVTGLGGEAVLKTAEHASLESAWEAFVARLGRPAPRAAGIAVACPVDGPVLRLTNNPWIIRPAMIPQALGVDRFTLVNDFGAVGHAVAHLEPAYFRRLCGPDRPLPDPGVTSIVGPGTGLGVAMLVRSAGGGHQVIETEGGHADFAPLDAIEDKVLERLRRVHRRVSAERVVSGPGLANLHQALAAIEGQASPPIDDAALWTLALSGEDALAATAFDRFCLSLGAVAGDIALVQGAGGVVIAGGLGLRIAPRLAASGFESRFRAKGRFEARMADIPVKLITHPQPGLYGAAVAFLCAHG